MFRREIRSNLIETWRKTPLNPPLVRGDGRQRFVTSDENGRPKKVRAPTATDDH